MNVAMVSHAPNVSQIGLYPQVGYAWKPAKPTSTQILQPVSVQIASLVVKLAPMELPVIHVSPITI